MKKFIPWLTDFLNEEDDFEWTKEKVIETIKNVQEQLLSEGENEWDGTHYGDCTKQNISCMVCWYQTWLDEYEKYCREEIKKKYSPFDVVLIEDYDVSSHLYKGTKIKDCYTNGKIFKGMFNSMFGSYEVEVPVEYCKKIDYESNIRI